jgi:5-methylcytosine-specific restriction enzyme subunit McrC
VTSSITVREYARLTTTHVAAPTLDRAQISPSAFDWLCNLNSSINKAGAALVQVEGSRWLKLDNYVGVVQSPCGALIEILPKHFDDGESIKKNRALLKRMIQIALDLPNREVGEAQLELFQSPLSEWVIRRFLEMLDHLVKRGVRFEYNRLEREERYLRGQLKVAKQMRQRPGRSHLFHVAYDEFSPDRAENRLLKLAVERASKSAQLTSTWRLANELRNLLHKVPTSINIGKDFKGWRRDRGMTHYDRIKPWCELILGRSMPKAVVGDWEGISFLFPMERLFELYVTATLKKALRIGAELRAKPKSLYLCEHNGDGIFRLEPDLLIKWGTRCCVLDTKWKRIDGSDTYNKYGLAQSDFYQLFAYGRTYLKNHEDRALVLIYPKHTKFGQPLPVFKFPEDTNLWVLPFDLERGELEGFGMANLPLASVSNNSNL